MPAGRLRPAGAYGAPSGLQRARRAPVEGGEHPEPVVGDGHGVLPVRGRGRSPAVTTVQSSPGPGSRRCPRVTIGSIATVSPDRTVGPAVADAVVRAPAGPGASRCRCRGRRSPRRCRSRRRGLPRGDDASSTAAPTSYSGAPTRERGDPGPHRVLGGVDQRQVRRCGPASPAADDDGDRGVAVPAVDDRAAVDGDQVALDQHARARDAVHDLVVDRDAERRR